MLWDVTHLSPQLDWKHLQDRGFVLSTLQSPQHLCLQGVGPRGTWNWLFGSCVPLASFSLRLLGCPFLGQISSWLARDSGLLKFYTLVPCLPHPSLALRERAKENRSQVIRVAGCVSHPGAWFVCLLPHSDRVDAEVCAYSLCRHQLIATIWEQVCETHAPGTQKSLHTFKYLGTM